MIVSRAVRVVGLRIIASAVCAVAMSGQTITGLPDVGLSLSGDPGQPLLRNNAERRVIVYTIRFSILRNGNPFMISRCLSALLNMRNQLSDEITVPPNGERSIAMAGRPGDVIQSVSLDAAIFEDGEIVGPDSTNTSDRIAARIQAERDLGDMVLAKGVGNQERTSLWTAVHEVAKAGPRNTELPHARNHEEIPAGRALHLPSDAREYARIYREQQMSYATELSSVQQKAGDVFAIDLASRSVGYPSLWRRK
jgi:hypothetical protein